MLCDRVGAQALHEDLTGASFKPVCHKDPATGAYSDKVDETKLPPAIDGAVDRDGNPVSVDQQNANRAHALARVNALARRRGDLIAALDATFPDIQVAVHDVKNADPTHSCDPPTASGMRKLSDELADMLGRFTQLYDDGTIPQSTESLARMFDAIKASPEAQQAFARFESRQGYRPIQLTLGAARPIIAYPNLRDLSNAALALLSADSRPYDSNAPRDDQGNRIPVPGPANAQLQKLLEVAHHEFLYATPDPAAPALKATTDPLALRRVLSRPRTDLEVLENVFYAPDVAFGGGAPQFIVQRDPRGYALVNSINGISAPFVDKNGDGLADVDALGRFVTTDGQPPPSPFFAVGQPYGQNRDLCGRVLRGTAATSGSGAADGGAADAGAAGSVSDLEMATCHSSGDQTLYSYLDTSHVFAASLMNDLKVLTNPDPAAKHETLMYAAAGATVLLGSRDGAPKSAKCYAPDPKDPSKCTDPSSILQYDAYHSSDAALLDLVYALGQLLGDPSTDDTLRYVRRLFTPEQPGQVDHEPEVARLAGDALQMKAIADAHPEAHIPAKSVLWDEMIDVAVKIEQEPGLLEDLLRAFGDDASQNLGQIFANYMNFKDHISYDRKALNGPAFDVTTNAVEEMKTPVDRSQPDTGDNRSAFQAFLQAVHDTNGVTACNKEGAVVHARGVALIGNADICAGALGLCSLPGTRPFHECEVFKIDNLAKFYLDSIIGKANLYFRPAILRNGIVGIGAATVDTILQSSGIGYDTSTKTYHNDFDGFWDDTGSKTFRPRPQWLNRLVFFDVANDNTSPTHDFIRDLQGTQVGTSVCPERVIDDPVPDAADASPDHKVHGLRSCPDGDWLNQRGKDATFVWEQFGFYKAITPLLTAFVNHNREDLFVELMEVMHRHWQDDKGTADECLLSSDPNAPFKQCTKDGVSSYEPIVSQQFATDIIPALHDAVKTLETETITHCDAVDPNTHACTTHSTRDGIAVIAETTRAMLDPKRAQTIGLKDRHGNAATARNDGTPVAQVTPLYLLLDALNHIDAAFAASGDKQRLADWRTARSQLVDRFLGVTGSGKNAQFSNIAVPKIVPTILDVTREQLFAHCPTSFSAPFDRCAWARDQLTQQMANVVDGPTFAATVDLLEAIRQDDPTRRQTGLLVQYLLDAASKNDALPNVLASANDILQLLKDDTNLVPLYHVLGPALQKTLTDPQGHIVQKSVVDAQLSLLARITGRAYDASGKEICAAELDPNEVLKIGLANLVTPMKGANGQPGQTPLQVIMDVIGDVNRQAPERTDKFTAQDYASIADNVSDFMLNKQRGLEQFYEIVRQGTVSE